MIERTLIKKLLDKHLSEVGSLIDWEIITEDGKVRTDALNGLQSKERKKERKGREGGPSYAKVLQFWSLCNEEAESPSLDYWEENPALQKMSDDQFDASVALAAARKHLGLVDSLVLEVKPSPGRDPAQRVERLASVVADIGICYNQVAAMEKAVELGLPKKWALDPSRATLAGQNGSMEAMDFLLKHGAHIGSQGGMALALALRHDHFEMAGWLLDSGAVPVIAEIGTATSVVLARKGQIPLLKKLAKAGIDITTNNHAAAWEAAGEIQSGSGPGDFESIISCPYCYKPAQLQSLADFLALVNKGAYKLVLKELRERTRERLRQKPKGQTPLEI
jgi:hypothetical protein